MATMDTETIRRWIEQSEAELRALTAEEEHLMRRIAQMRQQLNLMYELLATTTGEQAQKHPEADGVSRPVRERVVEAVVEILRDHGKPMRIQDIHIEFLRRQLPLPGSGTPANIAAHLVDRDLFTRPSRGVFGLAEWKNPGLSASSDDAAGNHAEELNQV